MQSYSGAGNAQAEQLKQFWQGQLVEVSEVPSDPAVFKNHQLPLARIKKACTHDYSIDNRTAHGKRAEPACMGPPCRL